MPAILELLYREFCRARLAEMRKQLLLTGKRDELVLPDEDFADPDAEMDAQHDELNRTRK
ncbi:MULTISPECIES: hypothetical protein [unclassified Bradyrhizobium]|uniref:hypothetical protein n=1 Tax=unclassified Bradyrhizobium TaxID=2631580 RepID=UPI0024B1CB48|nr:hypothetical protein [Bradyrhizobium sp. CB2312]WFU74722.1 hypothetical protein QA642_11995 [Bradyrhizobium sp. CB2312]